MMWRQLKQTLLGAPRWQKQAFLVMADLCAMVVALHLALALRTGSFEAIEVPAQVIVYFFSALVLFAVGFYRVILRAFTDTQMRGVVFGLVGLLLFCSLLIKLNVLQHMPRTVPWVYGFLLLSWLWFSRYFARLLLNQVRDQRNKHRVLIYGAGNAGRQVLNLLQAKPDMQVVGLLDDDPVLWHGQLAEYRVYPAPQVATLIQKHHIDTVLLAMPSATRQRRKQILDQLQLLHVRVLSIPNLHRIVDGKIAFSDLRAVEIADLLGRDPVPPVTELLARNVQGKRVMVTGAGGSIGSELCRQIIRQQPAQLILLEHSEYALYAIEQELRPLAPVPLLPILASVRQSDQLQRILSEHPVQTIYHAAAYKHVPLVEANPFEGVLNNVLGTYHCAQAAQAAGVEAFVLISTDKAVRPTNVMGASKRICELVCQALAQQPESRTVFSMVRFGNVLGSSGSVVPLFREQIRQGGPVTVTDPEMTRYFMTIPEAAQLVIQAGAMADGGDVFVLDMGEPVRIVELAKKMILLSGLSIDTPEQKGDIEIRYSGLRPGEKLYEELLIGGDNIHPTQHPLIMKAFEKSYSPDETRQLVERLQQCAAQADLPGLLALLEQYVEGYRRPASSPSPVP